MKKFGFLILVVLLCEAGMCFASGDDAAERPPESVPAVESQETTAEETDAAVVLPEPREDVRVRRRGISQLMWREIKSENMAE